MRIRKRNLPSFWPKQTNAEKPLTTLRQTWMNVKYPTPSISDQMKWTNSAQNWRESQENSRN